MSNRRAMRHASLFAIALMVAGTGLAAAGCAGKNSTYPTPVGVAERPASDGATVQATAGTGPLIPLVTIPPPEAFTQQLIFGSYDQVPADLLGWNLVETADPARRQQMVGRIENLNTDAPTVYEVFGSGDTSISVLEEDSFAASPACCAEPSQQLGPFEAHSGNSRGNSWWFFTGATSKRGRAVIAIVRGVDAATAMEFIRSLRLTAQ